MKKFLSFSALAFLLVVGARIAVARIANPPASVSIPVTEVSGGTNQTTYATGDTLYASGTNTLSKLPGNTTTAPLFLSQTGTGSASAAPQWTILPTQGTLSYYFYGQQATSSPAYFKMVSMATTTKSTLAYTGITTTQVLQNFITNAGFPGIQFIPSGEYEFHIHANQTAGTGTNGNVYAEFWEVDANGANIALIGTSGASPTLVASEQEYSLAFFNPNVYTLTSTASRIMARVWFTRIAGTDTANLFVGGTADSHISLPSNTVDATNFVPYTGATSDVNLGAHSLAVGGFAHGGSNVATDGSTITIDWSKGNTQEIVLGAAGRTLAFTNVPTPGNLQLWVWQDASGSRTITTYPTGTHWAGGTAPTLTTGAGKMDRLSFSVSTSTTYIAAGASTNY